MPFHGKPPLSPADREHRATVAAGFVTGLLSRVPPGRTVRDLLAKAGILPGVLDDPAARVSIASYVALYNATVEALDDEAFGLFAAPLRPGSFEFLCRALLGSRDLADALARGARFLAVVLPGLRLAVRREGAVALLEISETQSLHAQPDHPSRVFAFEWLLRLVHGLACWLVARPITLREVSFPYARPRHAADYALIYTERSTFGSRSLLAAIDASTLDLPVVRTQADLEGFLAGAPGKISMLYRRDRDTTRALREYVTRAIASSPSLEDAARALGLSSRTLHRRLREEGTSFRDVKDTVRRELALASLERGDRRVADVAADLGYSEPSAFFRAFHSWTGKAPTAYRKRLANG